MDRREYMKAGLVGLFLAPLCGAAGWLKGLFGAEKPRGDDSWKGWGYGCDDSKGNVSVHDRISGERADLVICDEYARLSQRRLQSARTNAVQLARCMGGCFACDGGLVSDWDLSRGPLPLCRTHLQLWSAPRI